MQANNKPKKQAKEPANLTRNKKSDLAKQFQEFKQRIQEFEDKNEEIINRIRQTYSFKKKNIDTRQLPSRFPAQMYNQPPTYNENQSDYSSCDLSQKIVYEGNFVNQNNRIRAYEPQYYNQAHYNTNYRYWEDQNNQFPHEEKPGHSTQELAKGQKQFLKNLRGHKTMMQYDQMEHNEPKLRNFQVRQQTGKFFNQQTIQQLENRLQEVLSKNSVLEHQIQARQQQINRVKANQLKQRSFINNTKKTLEEQLYKYEENVVAPKFDQIQRYLRKCCNRMKNMLHKIKDQAEERQAHRAIQRSREKRRLSAKFKQPNSSTSSVDMKDSSVSAPRDLPRPSASRSTSNLKRPQNKSQIRSKQKQFEQIACQYEKMIKNKVDEIEQLQRKLKMQLSQKEKLSNQIRKCHKLLEEKAEATKNGNTAKKQNREQPQDSKQVKELRQKVFNLQLFIKQKEDKQKQLLNSMQKLEKSKKLLFQQQKQSHNKSLVKKNESIAQLEEKIKKVQNDFFKELNELKQKNYIGQKQLMEKDVENMGMINKLKKLEADLFLKDQKLKQLEKLILKQSDQSQLLQKSMSIDASLITHADFKNLQQTLKKLEQELEEKINRIYQLERQVQKINGDLDTSHQQNQKYLRNIELLEKRIKQMSKEADNKMLQMNEKQSARQIQQKEMIFEEFQESQKELLQEKQQLLEKNRTLLQDLKKVKDQNLSYNREIIKLNSQITFGREEYQSVLQKYTKTKEQITQARLKLAEQDTQFKEKENIYTHQIKNLQIQIQNLTNHISELEVFEKTDQEKDQENLLNSLHVSEVSFNLNNRRYNQEQLNALKDRIKELQVQIQMKELIEKEMQNEYKVNLERIRSQTSQNGSQLHKYVAQIDELKKQLQKALQQKKDDISFQNYKISLYEEKIVQLENQYNISRQSEQRLNDLLHQLMQSTKEKSQQRNRLMEELQLKDKAIQEMKQLLDLKSSKGKQDSKWNLLRSSGGDQSEQLSDIAQLSYLSNISDVFKKDEVLQQKMRKGKTSREQFVKLFTKTSAYIKTLKQLIQNKDKRIRTLQKQVCSLKNNENSSWCGGSNVINKNDKKDIFRFSKTEFNEDKSDEQLEQFKDYESLQLDTRRTRSYELIKQLQKQKQLIVEQNNMLLHQIEALQDQLVKAEEQENSLVRIKDLYKDEIKKLMEKNQAHNKEFEIQINKMKQELETSVSFHNWEALKQLVHKIISSFAALQDVNQKAKREQRKKQIEEYLKVMSCIVALQTANKNGSSKK